MPPGAAPVDEACAPGSGEGGGDEPTAAAAATGFDLDIICISRAFFDSGAAETRPTPSLAGVGVGFADDSGAALFKAEASPAAEGWGELAAEAVEG